jgi:hypothetical protein
VKSNIGYSGTAVGDAPRRHRKAEDAFPIRNPKLVDSRVTPSMSDVFFELHDEYCVVYSRSQWRCLMKTAPEHNNNAIDWTEKRHRVPLASDNPHRLPALGFLTNVVASSIASGRCAIPNFLGIPSDVTGLKENKIPNVEYVPSLNGILKY